MVRPKITVEKPTNLTLTIWDHIEMQMSALITVRYTGIWIQINHSRLALCLHFFKSIPMSY